ncbi:NB-ARC domain-containing protein [Streptomyces alkaliphilus]|uniref:NB-ARC domain-containing protein n=1 Tax=Streptomyces alkaliphilus TaxID=1472722 RepID=UPI0015F88372|nr:NB-ARC domain-containing protein [Streptomyces alkaliphilus]
MAATLLDQALGQDSWPGPLEWFRAHPWVGFPVGYVLVWVLGVGVRRWRSRVSSRVPPPPEWVVDRDQLSTAARALLRRRWRKPSDTVLICGAGGFGKTILATMVANHRGVRRRFPGGIDMVTIGRAVRGPRAIAAKVAGTARYLTDGDVEFPDPDEAGSRLGALMDSGPRRLLILDDVWEYDQLAPFMRGGSRCTRLITTRDPHLLTEAVTRIEVGDMEPEQAREVLTRDLSGLIPPSLLDELLAVTGHWALLLRLTNRLIFQQVSTGRDPVETAEEVLAELRARGPVGVDHLNEVGVLDIDDPRQRAGAVGVTIKASTDLLPPGGFERYAELSIFPQGDPVPVKFVLLLWKETAGTPPGEAHRLIDRLRGLSLVSLRETGEGGVILHDVLRDYLRAELGEERVSRLTARWLAVVGPGGDGGRGAFATPHPDDAGTER